jgi:transcriptional regulator
MHPNPAFRGAPDARNLDFARARGFGTLTVNGPEGPIAAHVPFILAPDGASAALHLARSNPILGVLDPTAAALLAVTGPDAYISPDWYGMDGQVPTWNYVAVHLRGTLRRLPEADLRPHLAALSATFEGRLDKRPWTPGKLDEDALARLERMIVPVMLDVARIDGTWKFSQNKPVEARLAASAGVRAGTVGSETGALARLMGAEGA